MKTILFVDLSVFRGGAEVSLEKIIGLQAVRGVCALMKHPQLEMRNTEGCAEIKDAPFTREELLQGKSGIRGVKALAHIFIKGAGYDASSHDIIFSNTFKAHIFAFGVKFAAGGRIKWILAERDMPENLLIRTMKRVLYGFSDETVFPSQAARQAYGWTKGEVVGNIIDSAPGGRSGRSILNFAYTGGKTYDKGADRAAEVFSLIKMSFDGARLISAGGVPDYAEGKAVSASGDGITETGYGDLEKIYSSSSFLLFFNRRRESFSRICAEAMAAGCIPCILKGSGMDDYAINGFNALMFDRYDPNAISERIKSVISSGNDDVLRMSENAMKTVSEKFSAETIEKKWFEILGDRRR